MSDAGARQEAVAGLSSTVQLAPVSATAALPGVVLITPAHSGVGPAAVTVGLVLAEAIALHVGYGALQRVAGPAVCELFRSD